MNLGEVINQLYYSKKSMEMYEQILLKGKDEIKHFDELGTCPECKSGIIETFNYYFCVSGSCCFVGKVNGSRTI